MEADRPGPTDESDDLELTRDLVAIGFGLAADPSDAQPDIEETLVKASIDGLLGDDLRVLSILTTWLGVHHPYVDFSKVAFPLDACGDARMFAYWAAVARWLGGTAAAGELGVRHVGARIDLLSVGTEIHVRRRGEDPRFDGSPLRVPAGVLRDRTQDVSTPERLASRHDVYGARFRAGRSWRRVECSRASAGEGPREFDDALEGVLKRRADVLRRLAR